MLEADVAGETVRLVLDTGASKSAIDAAFARKIGVTLRGGGEVEGSAGVERARAADVDIAVGPFGRATLECTVYALGSYDDRCVGILGGDFLAGAPFQIFYRDRRWSRGAALAGERIPMSLDNGIPRIRALVKQTPIDLRIDTGATFPPGPDAYLNVTTEQAAALKLSGPPHAVFSASGTGGAKLELRVYELDSFAIGMRHLERAFAIVQPRVGYFARDDAVGFLGNSVLDKLDPGFDYGAGVLAIGQPDAAARPHRLVPRASS